MRVIPVIDLMDGQVVRGIAGRRSEYKPIESRIASDARPGTIAKSLVDRFGFETVYVADLDAIVHGRPDAAAWKQIAATGLKLWLDAGAGSARSCKLLQEMLAAEGIAAELVIGLESLLSLAELERIVAQLAPARPIFSLDLKQGVPLTDGEAMRELSPLELAERAASAGIQTIIVLDLADVGTGNGPSTIELCRQIAAQTPLKVVAGGGVRGLDDLKTLAAAGCDAALVASSLHDGRLERADLELLNH